MKVSNTKFLENPSGTSELFHAAKRTDAYDEGESRFSPKKRGYKTSTNFNKSLFAYTHRGTPQVSSTEYRTKENHVEGRQ